MLHLLNTFIQFPTNPSHSSPNKNIWSCFYMSVAFFFLFVSFGFLKLIYLTSVGWLGFCWGRGLSFLSGMWDLSSLTSDWTCYLHWKRILHHWTTREDPGFRFFFFNLILYKYLPFSVWLISHTIIPSRSFHLVANCRIFFLSWLNNIQFCEYTHTHAHRYNIQLCMLNVLYNFHVHFICWWISRM